MKTEKIKLKDVDGAIPGRAALVSIKLGQPGEEMESPQYSPFVEGEYNCSDPRLSARALWESIKDDFPGHSMAIIANPRADYLSWVRKLKSVGMSEYDLTPQEYLRSVNS